MRSMSATLHCDMRVQIEMPSLRSFQGGGAGHARLLVPCNLSGINHTRLQLNGECRLFGACRCSTGGTITMWRYTRRRRRPKADQGGLQPRLCSDLVWFTGVSDLSPSRPLATVSGISVTFQ
jgi:hypothetical protein